MADTEPSASEWEAIAGPSIVMESAYSDGVLHSGDITILDEQVIGAFEIPVNQGYKILTLEETGERVKNRVPLALTSIHAAALPQQFLDKWLVKLPPYLRASKIHVVVSTEAGTGLALHFYQSVLRYVLGLAGLLNGTYVMITKDENSVKKFVEDHLLALAQHGVAQTAIFLSGDGGIVETLNVLAGAKFSKNWITPVISLVPLGTGNALYHSIHKPLSAAGIYAQALRTLLQGTPTPLPAFQAKFSPGARLLTDEARTATPLLDDTLIGAVVASYGFHSTLVANSDTAEYRKLGAARFGVAAQKLLDPGKDLRPHAYLADVTVRSGATEAKVPREEHGYLLATLVSNLEKTFTISPDSRPLDGKLRFVHFGALAGSEIMDIMQGAYAGGEHIANPFVGYSEVDHIRIEFKEPGEDWEWRRACIDGSIVAVEEGGWMEISLLQQEYLKLLAPGTV